MIVRLCDVCAKKIDDDDSCHIQVDVNQERRLNLDIVPLPNGGDFDLCGECGRTTRATLVRTIKETTVML